MTITKRGEKGTALTYEEMDENIRDLYEDTDLDRVLGNGNSSTKTMNVGGLTINGQNAGSLTVNNKTTAYTLQESDANNLIVTTGSGIFIPAETFLPGQAIYIFNEGANDMAVSANEGVTLYVAGTTITNSTGVVAKGMCEVYCIGDNKFVLQADDVSLFNPLIATGGTVENVEIDGVSWKRHTFLNSDGQATFEITSPGTLSYIQVYAWGAGGSHGSGAINAGGGSGGFAYAQKIPVSSETLRVSVGGAGNISQTGGSGPWLGNGGGGSPPGPSGGSAHGGAGGGGTFLFRGTSSSPTHLVVAGGGGGGGGGEGGGRGNGGGGGGAGENGNGGTYSSGGSINYSTGTEEGQFRPRASGDRSGPGGGGGGYWGGGAGNYPGGDQNGGGGAGGGNYVINTATNATTINGNYNSSPPNWTNSLNNSTYGRGATSPQNGILIIQYPLARV